MARKAPKARTRKDRELEFFRETMSNNSKAVQEGPRKKSWSAHDLRRIKPLNATQRMMFESFIMGNHVIANGSAGTGKSYVALFLALNDLLNDDSDINKIMIVRSAVPSREIGHLPGDIKEKMAPYEEPYKDIVGNLMCKGKAYEDMKDANLIEFVPTSFVRGLTWDNSVVIIDEAQNMMLSEFHSVITRIGSSSKVIVCGDIGQNDLNFRKSDISGYADMLRIAERMNMFDIINFTEEDIVRSAFVKAWIIAKQSM